MIAIFYFILIANIDIYQKGEVEIWDVCIKRK